MSQSPLDVAGFGRVVLSVMPTIRQATWRGSVAGGSLQPITGFTSECDYCAERVFEADEVRCMSLTLDHRIFCPDAPPIELPHQGGQHMNQDTETRTIDFRPAFHRCTDPEGNFGIGDVRMFWTLTHDGWGMTWDVFTNWGLPAAEFKAGAPTCQHPSHQSGYPTKLDAAGGAVDWHSPVPMYDEQTPSRDDYPITGGACYLDSGFMLGDELFDLLRVSGGEAVWTRLRELLDERRQEHLATKEAST